MIDAHRDNYRTNGLKLLSQNIVNVFNRCTILNICSTKSNFANIYVPHIVWYGGPGLHLLNYHVETCSMINRAFCNQYAIFLTQPVSHRHITLTTSFMGQVWLSSRPAYLPNLMKMLWNSTSLFCSRNTLQFYFPSMTTRND